MSEKSLVDKGTKDDSQEEKDNEAEGPLDSFMASFTDQTDLIGVGHMTGAAIHAFLGTSGRARWGERIFWFCIILVGVGATLWQLAGVFGLYLAYGTSSQVSISFESPMDFPSVTICNLNPVLKSTLHLDADIQAFMQKQANAANNITQCQLQSIIYKKNMCKPTAGASVQANDSLVALAAMSSDATSNSDGTPLSNSVSNPESNPSSEGSSYVNSANSYSDNSYGSSPADGDDGAADMIDPYYQDPTSGSPSLDFNKQKTFLSLLGNLKRATRIKMGVMAKDMIQSCTFKGRTCTYKDFGMVMSSDYNLCWQFNSDQIRKTSLTTAYSGPRLGLNLVLYAQEDEYNDNFSDMNGFRILVHPFNTLALPEQNGFYVNAGTLTSASLRTVRMTYLSAPYNNNATCGTDDSFQEMYNAKYTRDACTGTCLERYIANKCKCMRAAFVDLYPLQNRSLPTCNVAKAEVKNCINNLINQTNYGELDCYTDCPTPCNVTLYEATLSSTEWPTDTKWSELVLGVCQSGNVSSDCKNFVKQQKGATSSMRQSILRDNFASVEIFFSELNLEQIDQQEAYGVTQLGADIGGAAGLWVGLCAFSGVEMIVFLIMFPIAAVRWLHQRRKARNSNKVHHAEAPPSVTDTSAKPKSAAVNTPADDITQPEN